MRRGMIGVVCLLAAGSLAVGGPMEGPSWSKKELPAGSRDGKEPGSQSYNKVFAAGQRACVIAIGDHNPVVDLEILVYDAKDQLVAQARGKQAAPDYVSVIWYPPRQERYRVVINNYSNVHNVLIVTFK